VAYTRPDVYVTETLRTGVRTSAAQISPVGTFVGESWKGPDDRPLLVTSWTDYTTHFGGFRADLANGLPALSFAVNQFFVNGGGSCYVQRVTDGSAVAASSTIFDRADTDPIDTITITAASKGAWGNALSVLIADRGGATSGRFDLLVYNGAAVDANIVERFIDLSIAADDDRYVVGVVNSATRGSAFITVEDLESATLAPDNAPASGTYVLTGGVDGGVVADDDYAEAITRLDQVDVGMVINIPGVSDTDTVSALAAFCEGRTDSFAVIDTEPNIDPAAAITYASTISPASSYAAVYWPWLVISDPSVNRAGATRTVAPGGAVVGTYIRTDIARGPQKTPAGIDAVLRGVVGLQSSATLDELGDLNEASVNAIRAFAGSGLTIMGGRTLKPSGSDRYIATRRSLIYIKTVLTDLLRFAVFESNDGVLWSSISNEITQVLTNYWQQGGLRGATAQEAFFVKCDAENNPEQSIEAGELHVEVGVATQYPAEFVILRLGQFKNGSVTVTETAS
jgi:hypothetical protein